jgi:hypothetical protein
MSKVLLNEKIVENPKPVDALWADLYNIASDYKRQTLGKVLTRIDAIFQDPIQRKGVKDLMKEAFWMEDYDIRQYKKLLKWFDSNYDITPGAEQSSKPLVDNHLMVESLFQEERNQ